VQCNIRPDFLLRLTAWQGQLSMITSSLRDHRLAHLRRVHRNERASKMVAVPNDPKSEPGSTPWCGAIDCFLPSDRRQSLRTQLPLAISKKRNFGETTKTNRYLVCNLQKYPLVPGIPPVGLCVGDAPPKSAMRLGPLLFLLASESNSDPKTSVHSKSQRNFTKHHRSSAIQAFGC
jgi:hypothetical protein